ncbi:ABC transporter substrate-binding protein [Bradyrhizobium prioriisuperbiae]|uniref:ABC transporter substrate-binding protein n=1 Tax=Bradyrhizobium prioriisuperbiae TaxID=2854389 RepID=UPI0028EB0647|nr:extracellular solute-binding protein [Bradyrhizobium prioritasuperba]
MAETCFGRRGTRSRRVGWRCLAASVIAVCLAGITSAQAQKLIVWSGYPEMEPFYRHVADGMKAKFPNLQVSVEAIPLREHEKRVALGLASGGSGALVIELGTAGAARYLNNDLLPKAPANVVGFVGNPANFSAFFRDSASLGGAVYGVPLFHGQVSLFYNLDMFREAGLTRPPATMAEYDAYAEKLTRRDSAGKSTVSGWSLRLSGGGQGIAEKFWINLFQFGGNILSPTADGKWRVTLVNEAGRNALKQYLVNVHKTKTVSPEMPADAEAFERGQTAMFIRESWVIADIAKKAPSLNYATAPLPRGSISIPTNLYVSAKGAEADAAWAFALAANEPDNQIWLLKNVGWLPSRANIDYSPVTTSVPAFSAFVDYPKDYGFFALPAIDASEEVLARVAARLVTAFADSKLADDDKAIDANLLATETEVNGILKREGLLGK